MHVFITFTKKLISCHRFGGIKNKKIKLSQFYLEKSLSFQAAQV
jgi:hypothetical protein